MNEEQKESQHKQNKADWKGAFLILIGLIAIMGAIKYGAPWLWSLIKK